MLKHNLLLFFRNIKKYKTTFLINIIGLSSGFACVLLIALWVLDETNKDHFSQKDSDRHVQVFVNNNLPSLIRTKAKTPGPLTMALGEEIPEVDYAIPIVAPRSFYNGILSKEDKRIRAIPLFVGDGYFNVFDCDFIQGDKEHSLEKKESIVISEKMAFALFQTKENIIGKTINFDNKYFQGVYTISGVFKEQKNNSVRYDMLLNYDRFLEGRPNLKKWNNGGILAHLVLKPNVTVEQLNGKIEGFLKTKIEGVNQTLFAQKYSETYLYGTYENGKPTSGRIIYVRLFSTIALFILLLACINFTNLSTANAFRRLKEIGVKKATGMSRKHFISQYFGESILMALMAFVVSIILVILVLPKFNEIIGTQLEFSLGIKTVGIFISIVFFTGIVSGAYPAIYLSGLKPINSLKGKLSTRNSDFWVRKGLVVAQFSISIILLLAVLVISKQINYVQNADVGFDKDQIISFKKEGALSKDNGAFLSEVKNITGVSSASYMWGDLPGGISHGSGFAWAGQTPDERKIRFDFIEGGYDMVNLLGLEIIQGESLSEDKKSDKERIIFNEAAIKLMNYGDNPIGKKVYFKGYKTIAGVVKNFHFESLYEPIKPMFFIFSNGNNFVVKIDPKNSSESISEIEETYARFNPTIPFEFKFLDDNYQALYTSEKRVATLSTYFAGIAILISCLGLFGLAIFTASQRRKEIGIRKTLGQRKSQITVLLSTEFAKLVGIAILIGLPIAFFIMKDWLSEFAYKIELRLEYFFLTALLAMFIALATVATQAIRAANRNSIDALREE
jgi:ABC-type antimicrobial peptide transport system permease subunit